MIASWMIGDTRLTGLSEYYGPIHIPDKLYPDIDRKVLEAHADLLEGAFWARESNRLIIGFEIWIVHLDDRVVVVDAGLGNGKLRDNPRSSMLNTVLPLWLEAAGVSRESVTDVLLTHVHGDHLGWNTVRDGENWIPTFPNATYCIPRADFEYFKGITEVRNATTGAFFDSLMPVIDAAQYRFVEPGDTVAGDVEVVAAFGHTPGQLNYWLRRGGKTAVFCADVMHHPVQILRPDWNTSIDIQPEIARETRLRFLQRAAVEDALILPCHFGPPHCGFVRRHGDDFAFVPAAPGSLAPSRATSAWEGQN